MNKYYTVLIVLLLAIGCTPYKTLINYNAESVLQDQAITNYSPLIIQTNDLLQIELVSVESDAVAIFNDYQQGGYLINTDGNIDFPLIGEVTLAGKTIEEAKRYLLLRLDKYFVQQPTLNIRLINFKVTVSGEVGSPRTINVGSDKMNIIEAITLAGDFTNYSKRDSVLIIREISNRREFGYVNFNDHNIFNSPYFYLKQNDIVYVQPRKTVIGTIRSREAKFLPFISVGLSSILLLITIFNLR